MGGKTTDSTFLPCFIFKKKWMSDKDYERSEELQLFNGPFRFKFFIKNNKEKTVILFYDNEGSYLEGESSSLTTLSPHPAKNFSD
jgi:hypothetical protein